MLAKELGVLSLALRRPGDTTEERGDGETVNTLLGQDGESANENKRKRSGDGTDSKTPWLTSNAPPVEPPPAVEPPPPPKFVMLIRTNNGDRKYLFQEWDGPPVEADLEGAPTANTAAPPHPASRQPAFPVDQDVPPAAEQADEAPVPEPTSGNEPGNEGQPENPPMDQEAT
jgi:hypothetical protein